MLIGECASDNGVHVQHRKCHFHVRAGASFSGSDHNPAGASRPAPAQHLVERPVVLGQVRHLPVELRDLPPQGFDLPPQGLDLLGVLLLRLLVLTCPQERYHILC